MQNQIRIFRAPVLFFFIASGATGLILEVTWTRILGLVFGNTVYAASTVLTAYMLGLALGSTLLGRLADRHQRPLALYGLLEIGIGIYGMLFPFLAQASFAVYGWFYRSFDPSFVVLNFFRFAWSMLLLLPPTILMGGTLPVLGRHLAVKHQKPAQEIGYLYGANTLGAVFGCFLAGFVLIKTFGVQNTIYVAGIIALIIGSFAILLGRRKFTLSKKKTTLRKKKSRLPTLAPSVSGPLFWFVLIAFGLTGFCALAYEILWTKILLFVLTTSTYTFPMMLTVFLAGIALGSFFSSRFLVPRIHRPLLWFAWIELLICLCVLASILLLAHMERIDFWVTKYIIFGQRWQVLLIRFLDAVVILFPPTFLMGMAFPVVTSSFVSQTDAVGRRIGQIYAANTIGCVVGSFTAGFLLFPLLGTLYSLLVVIALNLAVGIALYWRAARSNWKMRFAFTTPFIALLIVAFIFTPANIFHKTINTYHWTSKITFMKEHPTGTVTVHDLPSGERLIAVSGVNVAGLDYMLRTTQKLQGYIPLILHPNPQRVCQIGFGSGETTRVGLDFGVENYHLVEICPAVFEAAKYFEEINHGSYRDPRVHKIIMDGKNYALLTNEKYDIVMNDSVYPGSFGGASLYTLDHFRNCRKLLKPGGLFSCWVPLDVRPSEMKMMLKSFQEAFPHCSLWIANNCLNKNSLFLGSLTPFQFDFQRIRQVMEQLPIAADLQAIDINNVYDLLDCHMCDEHSIRKLVQNAPFNTDNHPRLEYSCAIPIPHEGTLGYIFSMLAIHRSSVTPYVVNYQDEVKDKEQLELRHKASTYIFQAQVAQLLGYPTERKNFYNQARKVHPGEIHVATCEAELQREIRDLRSAYKLRPNNPILSLRYATKLCMAGQLQEAARIFQWLIDTVPHYYPQAYVHLAEIHFPSDRTKAKNILKRCLQRWPQYPDAHDRLAGIYIQDNRLEEAKHHISEATRRDPQNIFFQTHYQQIFNSTN